MEDKRPEIKPQPTSTPREQVQQEIIEIAKYTKAYAANFYGKGGPRTRVQRAASEVIWRVLDDLQNPLLGKSR